MDSPPKGQLGGRRALTKKVGFLKMDSPRRGNWAKGELFNKGITNQLKYFKIYIKRITNQLKYFKNILDALKINSNT